MATNIKNTTRGASVIQVTGAGTLTINVAANLATSNTEIVTEAHIKSAFWSTNGSITITRNSEKVLELYGSGQMLLSDYGYNITANSTSDIVIAVASGGTLVLEVGKVATYTVDPSTGMTLT
jgi:membrane carboxypeptidase/penicillin-binding protein